MSMSVSVTVLCNAREHALEWVRVLFYVRLYVRDGVHDLVRCGVSVSGRIRVRHNARHRCCSHVSVSGSDRDRCSVRGVTCPWPSSIVAVTMHVSIAVSMTMSVTLWPVTLWSVTSDLVRDRVCVHVQCPWPFTFPYQFFHVWAVSECRQSCPCLFPCSCSCQWLSISIYIRDRVGVHDRIRYILFVSVVVPIMSSVRGCGRESWPYIWTCHCPRFHCPRDNVYVLRGSVHA